MGEQVLVEVKDKDKKFKMKTETILETSEEASQERGALKKIVSVILNFLFFTGNNYFWYESLFSLDHRKIWT